MVHLQKVHITAKSENMPDSQSSAYSRKHYHLFKQTVLGAHIRKIQTRNTLTQASNNGRKPYLFPQKKIVSVFYVINIVNTINYFKRTNFNCA